MEAELGSYERNYEFYGQCIDAKVDLPANVKRIIQNRQIFTEAKYLRKELGIIKSAINAFQVNILN